MNFEKKMTIKGLEETRKAMNRALAEYKSFQKMNAARINGESFDAEKFIHVGHKFGEDIMVALEHFDKAIQFEYKDKYIPTIHKYRYIIRHAKDQARWIQLKMDTKLTEYYEKGDTSLTEFETFSLDTNEIYPFLDRLDEYLENGYCSE